MKRNPFVKPFYSTDDTRLAWLTDTFLKYFENWQLSIERRPGNFTQSARSNMFLSWQTHEGVKTTVHSAIELIKFLLNNNVNGGRVKGGGGGVSSPHPCKQPQIVSIRIFFGKNPTIVSCNTSLVTF